MPIRIYNTPEHAHLRKTLRGSMIKSERLLWGKLRARRLQWKFRRQHSVDSYIVDFYCPELKLAIEVDGISHEREEVFHHDKIRQSLLEHRGIKVMRFTTAEVCNELDRVVENIYQLCEELQITQHNSHLPPTPSP